jgi:hypothetical protein
MPSFEAGRSTASRLAGAGMPEVSIVSFAELLPEVSLQPVARAVP